MNTDVSNKVKPNQILGGAMGWLDEIGFEMETPSVSSVAKGVGGIFGDMFSLVGDLTGDVVTEVPKTFYDAFKGESENKLDPFPSRGSIEFNKKEEADRKKAFYQALEQDKLRAQHAKDRLLFEEEINDIATNLPTEEKNRLLHYQASYKDRSIYQRAELRRKLIEEKRKAEKQQKITSIPSPAKQPSALEGAFEGRSGSQGSGTANLSAQATG